MIQHPVRPLDLVGLPFPYYAIRLAGYGTVLTDSESRASLQFGRQNLWSVSALACKYSWTEGRDPFLRQPVRSGPALRSLADSEDLGATGWAHALRRWTSVL